MKKKPAKIEEPSSAYSAKKRTAPPAAPLAKAEEARQIRYATPEQARKAMRKVFRVHHELFRKLAQ